MKKIISLMLAIVSLIPASVAFAEEEIKIEYNGSVIFFNEKSIVMNQRTLVQLRPIAEALDLGIEYALESGTVILSNADCVVEFKQNSDIVNVNGQDIKMDVPMIVHNNYSFVPVRNLVEPFGNDVVYDGARNTIIITPIDKSESDEQVFDDETSDEDVVKEISTGSGQYESVFFYQSQEDIGFENNGRGYCWVCSYAMLFSNVSGEIITPLDVEQFNLDGGYSGNFMAGHETLARYFGFKLVPALSEDSLYFAGFNTKNRGETTLNVTSDDETRDALREALDNFPDGVLVRYEGYPHTMMAVDYDDEFIYFNDPAIADGEYITFDKTCLKNFSISDISFIQAVENERL